MTTIRHLYTRALAHTGAPAALAAVLTAAAIALVRLAMECCR